MWFVNFYLPFIRTLFIKSAPTKVGETDTRQPPYATSACQSVEPVSRKRTCKVGPGCFIPQYHWARKRLVEASKMTKSTPTTKLCSTRAKRTTHRPSSWCHWWGTFQKIKIFLRFHQDPSMSSSKQRVKGESLHLHTTCRSRAEACKVMM